MRKVRLFPKYFLILLLCSFLFLPACGQNNKSNSDDEIIAYVNEEPIFASELQRSIALRARGDPSFKVTPQTKKQQLDVLVDKKLIIQEAIDKGLAREDKFLNTIKTFWEQTLVRDFWEYKNKETEDYLFVTEEEIKKYYDYLRTRIIFRVFSTPDRREANEMVKKLSRTPDMKSAVLDQIGPVGYEDINTRALLKVFDFANGDIKVIEDGARLYVVQVVRREEIDLPALESMREEIQKRVLVAKEKNLFEDWLGEQRKKANVKIIKIPQ